MNTIWERRFECDSKKWLASYNFVFTLRHNRIAAGTYVLFPDVPIRLIFLTPIKSAIPFIQQYGGLVVCGTKDELFPEINIKLIEEFRNTTIHKVEGANHGLEVEDIQESISIMKNLVDLTNRFFKAK